MPPFDLDSARRVYQKRSNEQSLVKFCVDDLSEVVEALKVVSYSDSVHDKVEQFVSETVKGLKENGVALFTHDGPSDVKTLYSKYGSDDCDPKVADKVSRHLQSLGVQSETLHFVARAKFPEVGETFWRAVLENPPGKEDEPQDFIIARNLLTFCAQRPLRELRPDELLKFVADSKKLLAEQDNILYVDSICQIAISKNHDVEFPALINQVAARIQKELFLQGLPLTELHMHLDGSLEAEMMYNIAQRNEVDFPYDSVEKTRAAYNFKNLGEFLNLYFLGAGVMKEEKDFEDLAYAYLKKAHESGVVHSEMFVGPQTHTVRGIPFDYVMNGTAKAMDRAKADFGISSSLTLDFQRDLGRGEKTEKLKEEFAATEAQRTLDKLLEWRDKNPQHRDKVVAVGLDYQEVGFPPKWFKEVFARAKINGLRATCHAGEEGPAEYVWQAIRDLGVERVDHGNRSQEDENLMKYLIDNEIPLTMCPLSNESLLQLNPRDHPLKKFLSGGVKCLINSDDPAYFRGQYKDGYIKGNLSVIAEALDLSAEEILQLARNSIEASFISPDRKEEYLKQLNHYVERCESMKRTAPRLSFEASDAVGMAEKKHSQSASV